MDDIEVEDEAAERTADPTTSAERAYREECERDLLSVGGLRGLARRDRDWRDRLEAAYEDPAIRAERRSGSRPGATLRQVILAYSDELVPQPWHPVSVETIYAVRQLLRVVVAVAGEWKVTAEGVPLAELRELLSAPVEGTEGPRMAPGRVSRAVTLVRGALNRRMAIKQQPLIPKPAPAPPAPFREGRTTVPLTICSGLVAQARRGERAKIGLALGFGLRPSEVDALRGRDLRGYTTTVADRDRFNVPLSFGTPWLRVPARGRKGGVRWIPAPAWVTALLLDCPLGKGDEPLVGPDEAPAIEATLRRIRKEVPGAEGVTATSLAVTWQGIARHTQRSREVVRGTWAQLDRAGKRWPDRWHRAQRQLLRLADAWRTLICDLTRPLVDGVVVVPRRAPSGCPLQSPELRPRRRKKPAPLPPGVIGPGGSGGGRGGK